MEILNVKKLEPYDVNILESPSETFWLSPFFELARYIHYEYKPKPKSLIAQRLILLAESAIWCLQMVSFLWIPNLNIRNWKENSDFWRIIGYIRLDNACSAYGIINFCIYASLLITIISVIAISLMTIMIFYSTPIPSFILKIAKKILNIFSIFLTIPTFTLLIICLKYNWFPKTNVYEYYENNEISNFEVNLPFQILIIAGLFGYFLIYMVMSVICSAEIRHSMADRIIDSKAHSKIDIYLAFSAILIPILFTTIESNNIIFFQVILLVIFGALAIETLKTMPYFSLFTNCLTSMKCLQISLMSSFFILAKIIDASFIILLLFFIILPIIDAIIIYKIQYLKKNINPKGFINLEKIQNIFCLEHQLRDFFCSSDLEKSEELLSFLGKCFNETMLYKHKLLIVWEVNYCVFTLGDEALAKVKLCKSKFSDHSIEGDYQEYVCKKIVSKFQSSESEKFLVYFQKINKTKKEDAYLCIKLLDFWKEVVSEKPNLIKLNKMMDLVSNSVANITENYSNLHEKFPKSKEALTYYYTFAKHILYDIDKSKNLGDKVKSIRELPELSIQSKDTSFLDENNGVMLIYFENKNFGEIAFANQKSAEILKFPIDEIIGNKISCFIPPPYDTYLNQLPYYLQFVTDAEIKFPDHFFLSLPNKFLINCTAKGSLVSMHNSLFFLFVFQKINISQEFAIISPEWDISSHSENFHQVAGIISTDLRGYNVKHLFPSLATIDIKAFTPLFLADINKYLIYGNVGFYGLKINYVLLVNDPIEVEAWKTDKKIENIDKMFEFSPKYRLYSDFSQRKEESMSDGAFKTDFDKKIKPYHDLQSQSQYCKIDRIVFLSSRSIKIFHYAFILAILIVIFVNSIVLIYTTAAITAESSIELPILLGKIQKSVQALAYFSRGVNALYLLKQPPDLFDFAYYHAINSITILEEVHWNITQDIKTWNNCGGKEIFTEENILIWNVENEIHLEKSNLIDAISQFIHYGNAFISKWDATHIAGVKETQFFVLNGYNQVFHYCNKTLFDLADCEINNTKDLEMKMNFLLLAGFWVLIICLTFTLPFAEYVINRENNIWNQIKRQAHSHYDTLKTACLERLTEIHNKTDTLFSDSKHTSKTANFKNRWKYYWRNSLYLALALVFFLMNYFYLYHNCVAFLYLRPSLLRSIINSQVLYKTLLVWTSEALIVNLPASLIYQTPKVYPYINSYHNLDMVISSLQFSEREIRRSEYFSLLSEAFKEKFYKRAQISTEIADYGVYSAGGIISIDVYYIEYAGQSDWIMMWYKFANDANILDLEYDVLVDLANKDSQNVILEQLQWIIIAIALFVVCSFILYFGCYLFFLSKEKKNLEKMKTISRLIPRK